MQVCLCTKCNSTGLDLTYREALIHLGVKVALGGVCCVPPGGMISVPVTFASWCAHLALLPSCGFA